ncbi:MAG: hypothetical protein IPM66_03070 [Acidobacteriota bacterium]|nr:MAG: hypothetical protein IPM66_03070 [Acidobacteriota bacterium]
MSHNNQAMTREEALQFITKWADVEKIHIEEVRALSFEDRLRHLDNLYQFCTFISDIKPETREETLAAFANINKLRDLHERQPS